jgi:hypothetical protein
VEVGEAEGAESGGELVADVTRGLGIGGVVAEHDAQREPVTVLDDLELADVGVRGEAGELERVHGCLWQRRGMRVGS